MNNISNTTQDFLDSRQIFEGIKKVFPDSEKHSAGKWADMFAEGLNKQLVKESVGKMYRCSKLGGARVNQPCTLWFSGNRDSCDLYFIPKSSHVKVRRGTYKKVKDLFFLRISKEDPKDLPIKVVDLVLYRVQASGIFEVKEGLAMHKKIIENCDPKYFAAFPVVFPVYLGEKGIKKLEMGSPRYIGDMWEAISENFLSLSDRIDLCLDIAQGMCLLGKMTPPIVHRDLKLDNILLEKSEEEDRIRALIADFDKATHPISKNKKNPIFSSHLNFLTSQGQYSVAGDAYSLAILIGEVFLDGFSLVMASNFNEENVSDRVECQMGPCFFSLGKFKKTVGSECAKKVEEIFLGEKQVQELLLYAKTLGNTLEASLVKKFTFELAVFRPVFQLVLRALREEQKSKESVLRQGISVKEAAREFYPPSAEEIVQVLEKCKATHLLLEGFLEGKIEEEAPSVVSKSLCIRTQQGNLNRLNEAFIMHKNLMVFAENHIVPYPVIDLMCQGRKGLKRELYDSWSQGTLISELPRLNVEQKIDVYLDVLAALQCLHENNYVHMNIKPANILLRFSETGGVKARLSDFLWTTQPSLTGFKGEYYYWNSSSRNGYASKKSDLYGLMKVIRGSFLELSIHIKCDRNSAEQLILESMKKQYNPFMQKQIQKLFNEKMGYGEDFSRELMLLQAGDVVEQFALKSLLFPSLFALLKKMAKADLKMEKHVQGLRKDLLEADWHQALALFPGPNIEEIRQVLENGKASVKKLQAEFFSV